MNSTATFQGRSKKSLGLEGNTVLSDSSDSPKSSEGSESIEETRWVLLDFRTLALVKIRVLFQLTLSIFPNASNTLSTAVPSFYIIT